MCPSHAVAGHAQQAKVQARIGVTPKPLAPSRCAPQKWEDLELIYAGQRMADGRVLADYHVPPVSAAPCSATAENSAALRAAQVDCRLVLLLLA